LSSNQTRVPLVYMFSAMLTVNEGNGSSSKRFGKNRLLVLVILQCDK
jgi:hypothetical protein